MNLTTLYLWKTEFTIDQHVAVTKPFDIFYEDGKLLKHLEPGLNGKIVTKNYGKRFFSAYFEDDSFIENLDPSHFTIRKDLSLKEAYKTFKRFFSNNLSARSNDYLFNIKVHDLHVPDHVYQILGDEVWKILDEERVNALECFVGKNNDYAPFHFFDWIDNYGTTGASGGYLNITDRYNVVYAFDHAEYQYLEALDDHAYDNETMQEYYDDMMVEAKDLTERAYDLIMLEKLIKVHQTYLYDEVNHPEFWNEFMELERA